MKQRDKDILKSLETFRVLDRDQLIALHFKNVKNPIVVCNRVMNRLKLTGRVKVNDKVRPYEYMNNPAPFNFVSNKRVHFGTIADTFIEAKKLGIVNEFDIEPKLGKKGTVEPDMFMIWNRSPMFMEIQRSKPWSKKFMETKLDRYEEYFNSDDWKEFHWQRTGKEIFPTIVIISPYAYDIDDRPFRVLQATSMKDFVNKYKVQ